MFARAKSLINQSKEWIDSAVEVKEETVNKGLTLVEATGTSVHVEMEDITKALALLHAVMIAKLSSPSSVPLPVGTNVDLASVIIGSPPPKRECTVGCKLCDRSFSSVKNLHKHHCADHGIVTCDLCGKSFGTRTALDKHMGKNLLFRVG